MKSVKTIIPALILLITFTGSITGAEQTKSDKSFKVKKGGTLTMDLNPGRNKSDVLGKRRSIDIRADD